MTSPVEEPPNPDSDRQRLTWVRRLVWVVLVAGVVAFLVEGADNPPDPYLVPADADAGSFGEAEAQADATGGPDSPEGEEAAPASDPGASPSTSLASAPNASTTSRADPATEPTPPPASPTTVAAPPDPPPAPPTTATTATPATRRPLAGFEEITFRITASDGEVTNGMAMLADDGASRSQGLMEQTDLRGYDAMVFRFSSPTQGRFYMRNTRIPLSIAFFDDRGRFVSSADMEPCPDEVEECPTYGAARPYLHAIEVAQGDLPGLGIGPGSVLSFP